MPLSDQAFQTLLSHLLENKVNALSSFMDAARKKRISGSQARDLKQQADDLSKANPQNIDALFLSGCIEHFGLGKTANTKKAATSL